jgi:hypothetical protein
MTTGVKNRRELFRQYLRNLTAGASPHSAIRDGLYVPPPGRPIGERLVPRIDLDPTASHLIVGGIGTGKTTELIRLQEQLATLPDITGIYVDVSLHHDLSKLGSGVLVVIAGLALDRFLRSIESNDATDEREQFRNWAHGYTEFVDEEDGYEDGNWDPREDDDDEGHYVRAIEHAPILVPPEPQINSTISQKAGILTTLVQAAQKRAPHVVLMLDSLDRVSNLSVFEEIVVQDIRAIRASGIGTVVVGPLAVLFGAHRPTADRFEYVYQVSAVDVDADEGIPFLLRVLNTRVAASVLPNDSAVAAARFSGGILRDLMAIARAAGEEAYISGSSTIKLEHVNAAADAFGRDLMLGLSQQEIATLQRVRKFATFVQTSDEDIALLATRRVLEYGDNRKRYSVHPTIEPLLSQLAT